MLEEFHVHPRGASALVLASEVGDERLWLEGNVLYRLDVRSGVRDSTAYPLPESEGPGWTLADAVRHEGRLVVLLEPKDFGTDGGLLVIGDRAARTVPYRFFTYARMILSGRTLLMAAMGGDPEWGIASGRLFLARSDDLGLTWREPRILEEAGENPQALWLLDGEGAPLLIWRQGGEYCDLLLDESMVGEPRCWDWHDVSFITDVRVCRDGTFLLLGGRPGTDRPEGVTGRLTRSDTLARLVDVLPGTHALTFADEEGTVVLLRLASPGPPGFVVSEVGTHTLECTASG